MAAKAKKSSYILSFDVFYLTRWSGAMKLMGPLPLTYQPKNHIPMAESINFQFFLIFKFLFDLPFWCVFRWKPNTLGGVETCLEMILGDMCWKMLKDSSCLCFCVRGLEPVYVAWTYAYAALFLRTQVYSWGSAYVGMGLHMRGPVCVSRLWPAYVRCLAEALLCLFPVLFQLLHSICNLNTPFCHFCI